MPASYVVRMPAAAVTAAKTLIQITAGPAPITILDVNVDQITKTTHELLSVQIIRKTVVATMTVGAPPLKLQVRDAGSSVAFAGVNASAEGTDGDVLEDLVWNVASASWTYLNIDDAIVVPPGATIAVKIVTAPAASMTVGATLKFREEVAFQPTQISGLAVWLPASDLALTTNDPVTTWADRSGNGNNATQATGAAKPTFGAALGPNSGPAVSFDGTDDYLTFGDVMGASASTAFVVVKAFSDPAPGTSEGFWTFNSTTQGTHYGLSSNGNVYDGFGNALQLNTGNPTPSLAAWRVYTAASANSDWENYFDGVSFFSTGTNTYNTNTAPQIGRSEAGSVGNFHYFKGWWAEFLLYSRRLTLAEIQDITRWLSAKHSLGISI